MTIIDKIKETKSVKQLNIDELSCLAQEIRARILEVVKDNGGHLASNLGIVETTIALHYCFDFPTDKLIFDVGHQCYAHKILSGREDKFSSIRTSGGLAGFPDRAESEFDAFGTGHAGTSIAASLGYLAARDKAKEDYFVVSVVGDGALVNGLNLEALTHSNAKPKKHIVILNDNGMSISKNKNGFYRYLSKRTAKRGYLRGKKGLRKIFGDSFISKALIGFRNFIKRVVKKDDYFESHGYKYVGVVDGNNLKELIEIINDVKYASTEKAVFLHVKTTKGKGKKEAEENAEIYHGVGALYKSEAGNFSQTLGDKLCELIKKDNKIIAITAGMKDGTGLYKVENLYRENFVDVGIAEEFAVTYAAGMAAGGLKPVVAVYSTFMQRAYDQILHDVCLQNLPVVFCLDRAGLVGKDGKTHQGVFDLSYLTHLPNLTILAPTTTAELEDALEYALSLSKPVVIRYPKGTCILKDAPKYVDAPWDRVKEGEKVTILAVGPNMLSLAKEVAEEVDGVGIINARTVKPLCTKTLDKIKSTTIITLEENSVIGGFGALVSGYYAKENISAKVINFGVKDEFIAHGTIDEQLKENGLTKEQIIKVLNKA